MSSYIWSDRVRLVLQIKFYSNAMVGHFDEELNLLIWLNLSKSFYSKLENFSASVDVEIKLLASSYKFMSNPFTITWQLKIQILVEIPKMVQSYFLENLQASCVLSEKIPANRLDDKKWRETFGINYKICRSTTMVVFNVVTIKDGKEP